MNPPEVFFACNVVPSGVRAFPHAFYRSTLAMTGLVAVAGALIGAALFPLIFSNLSYADWVVAAATGTACALIGWTAGVVGARL